MNTPTQDPKLGIVIGGEYTLTKVLGRGGMGIVYQAERDGEPFAIKLLSEHAVGKERSIRRFLREARLIQSLDHEHIIRVVDAGTDPALDLPYIVMERLHGMDLAQLLDVHKPLAPAPLVNLILQACRGLEAAHARSIVHRDIKPSNLFLHSTGLDSGDGRVAVTVKVCDFGVAKLIDLDDWHQTYSGDLTRTESMLGSPMYMSPEQARTPKSVDHRTDIWSLGATLYEALSGRRLWPRQRSMGDLIVTMCTRSPAPLLGYAHWLDPQLAAVIHRALGRTPNERYPTMAAFAEALAPFAMPAASVTMDELVRRPTSMLQTLTVSEDQTVFVTKSDSVVRGEKLEAPSPAVATRVEPTTELQAPSRSTTETSVAIATGRSVRLRAIAVVGVVALSGVIGVLTRHILLAREAGSTSTHSAHGKAHEPSKAPGDGSGDAPASPPSAQDSALPVDIPEDRLQSFHPLPVPVPDHADKLAARRAALGKQLFFDSRLSDTGTLACATCHDLESYGVAPADGARLAAGPRNILSVYNAAGQFSLYWDGRAATSEAQAAEAIDNHLELASSSKRVIRGLRAVRGYIRAFAAAFPGDRYPITITNVAAALAAYQRLLVTPGRWDAFLRGDRDALSSEERRGFNTFVEAGCVTCHFGPYVGATMFQKAGLVRAWPNARDPGRLAITGQEADHLVFKVPSLRNVARTGPYFHDSSAATLDRAVALMARHQLGTSLDDRQIAAIVAWLGTLTGELPGALIAAPELPPSR